MLLTCMYDNKAETGYNAESELATATVKLESNWSVFDFLILTKRLSGHGFLSAEMSETDK